MTLECDTIARWLVAASRGVAFTGAGVSTESGIPDFRSPGGVWSRTQPVYFDDFVRSAESRREYWRQKAESHQDFYAAQPNIAHKALSRWESRGWLRGVITQNIDGLHQVAGSRSVLELHGTAREIGCLDICRLVEDTLDSTAPSEPGCLEDIEEIDAAARRKAHEIATSLH